MEDIEIHIDSITTEWQCQTWLACVLSASLAQQLGNREKTEDILQQIYSTVYWKVNIIGSMEQNLSCVNDKYISSY
jgi:hypothetical protein